jgi:dGTPase
MSDEVFNAMTELRQFLFENVYRSPQVHNEFIKAKRILTDLYNYFLNDETLLQKELTAMDMSKCNYNSQTRERCVCDFIASLTDRHALDLYSSIFFPMPLV